VRTDGSRRFQVAIAEDVPWIELRDPGRDLSVRRIAGELPAGLHYIDIVDAPPDHPPRPRGIKYSVYSDTSGLMEIEAAGGCPAVFRQGTLLPLAVTTLYSRGA
jgi:hypothetical protein